MLEEYRKIISGKKKANFIKNKKILKKILDESKPGKAYIKSNEMDAELVPVKTASLVFGSGDEWTVKRTAKWIEKRAMEKKGIIIDIGDMRENLLHLVEAFYLSEISTPIILKTDGYYSEKVGLFLKNLADVHIINFRHFSEECAAHLMNRSDYSATVQRNIILAESHGDLIIDHKILPSHIECDTKMLLEWIRKNVKNFDLRINPEDRPNKQYTELARTLSISEFNDVMKHARAIGLNI